MEIVEKGHASRKTANIRLRQPLATITVKGASLSDELSAIVKEELNVKAVVLVKGESLTVELDTKLTKELEEEGVARDLMRDIQGARKKLGLSPKDVVSVELPSWPASWEAEIKKKVNASSLSMGAALKVELKTL